MTLLGGLVVLVAQALGREGCLLKKPPVFLHSSAFGTALKRIVAPCLRRQRDKGGTLEGGGESPPLRNHGRKTRWLKVARAPNQH